MDIREISVKLDGGGNGQKVAISGVSAQSTAITLRAVPSSAGDTTQDVLVYVTADCFVANGANPTAVVDTGVPLAGGAIYRLSGMKSGDKLAFITSGAAGNAWIYPGA